MRQDERLISRYAAEFLQIFKLREDGINGGLHVGIDVKLTDLVADTGDDVVIRQLDELRKGWHRRSPLWLRVLLEILGQQLLRLHWEFAQTANANQVDRSVGQVRGRR